MMTAVDGYYENGVCVPTEALQLKNRQRVIITVLDAPKVIEDKTDKSRKIEELRSLCHPGKHIWTEDPADCIRRMRDDDRI